MVNKPFLSYFHLAWFPPFTTSIPDLTSFQVVLIPDQTLDPAFFMLIRGKISWLYFSWTTQTQKSSLRVNMFHPIFINRAWLCVRACRGPNPPCFFGLHTLFHATKCVFLWSSVWPHRKLQFYLSKSSQTLSSKWVVCIRYGRIVEEKELISVCLPTSDSLFTFHWVSVLLALSIVSMNVFFSTRWCNWTPRYFPKSDVRVKPKRLLISSLQLLCILLEKNILILESLTFMLELSQKAS